MAPKCIPCYTEPLLLSGLKGSGVYRTWGSLLRANDKLRRPNAPRHLHTPTPHCCQLELQGFPWRLGAPHILCRGLTSQVMHTE